MDEEGEELCDLSKKAELTAKAENAEVENTPAEECKEATPFLGTNGSDATIKDPKIEIKPAKVVPTRDKTAPTNCGEEEATPFLNPNGRSNGSIPL